MFYTIHSFPQTYIKLTLKITFFNTNIFSSLPESGSIGEQSFQNVLGFLCFAEEWHLQKLGGAWPVKNSFVNNNKYFRRLNYNYKFDLYQCHKNNYCFVYIKFILRYLNSSTTK